MLELEYSAHFLRDYKKAQKKHKDVGFVDDVIKLIEKDDKFSKKELKSRHKTHTLTGDWAGSFECHVAKVGDWLLVWQVSDGLAVLLRTGMHDEIFRK